MEKIKFDKFELFLGAEGEEEEERIMTWSQKQIEMGKDQFRRREDFVFCSSLAYTSNFTSPGSILRRK